MAFQNISLKQFLKWLYPSVVLLQSFKLPRPRVRYWYLAGVLGILACSTTYWYLLKDLPSPKKLSSVAIPLTTHIRDRNGVELYKIYSSQNRTLVKLDIIPAYLKQAVISIEDQNFYHHNGFSLKGSLRAAWHLISRQQLEGGSTITQQLVKTSLLTPERTLRRKLRELVLSFAVEALYSKDQILEMYLNRVGFGGAAYGVEEASQTYFGKSVKDLDLAQSSFLAGLPASPTTYSPYGIHPELAKSRQKEVLRRMVADGYITWDQADAASSEDLHILPPAADIQAPHFVMYVKDLLAQKYGTDLLEQGGLDVTTSLDLNLQNQAEKIVKDETAKIAWLHVGNGAALVTDPHTGEILAMVGSRDYFDPANDGNVNVTLQPRQPGSSIKPVNYSLAFSRGFTPASIIDDSPITYSSPGQPPYSPVNYDHRFRGRITLRTALASSINVPAVKLLSSNGVANMVDLGTKMGITTWNNPDRFGLSLTLGGGEVTMLDLSTVYGVFANLGSRVNPHPILAVRDSRGKLLQEFRCGSSADSAIGAVQAATEITTCPDQPVIDPKVAYLISDILSDNNARAPIFGYNSDLNLPGVSVKTGTTNDLRDNWTIGYTSDSLVAVWVGNNDNTPMSYVASGVTGASPIWRAIMTEVLKIRPPAPLIAPSGLLKLSVCSVTGQLNCSACPTPKTEYFVPGTEPKTACTDTQFLPSIAPTLFTLPKPTGEGGPEPPRPKPIRGKILDGTWTVR